MAIDWIFQHRPSSIDDMALYPALKKKLKYLKKFMIFVKTVKTIAIVEMTFTKQVKYH